MYVTRTQQPVKRTEQDSRLQKRSYFPVVGWLSIVPITFPVSINSFSSLSIKNEKDSEP